LNGRLQAPIARLACATNARVLSTFLATKSTICAWNRPFCSFWTIKSLWTNAMIASVVGCYLWSWARRAREANVACFTITTNLTILTILSRRTRCTILTTLQTSHESIRSIWAGEWDFSAIWTERSEWTDERNRCIIAAIVTWWASHTKCFTFSSLVRASSTTHRFR